MGKWMEAVRERPANDRPTQQQIEGECYPGLLLRAFEAIWAGKRRDMDPSSHFPMLKRIEDGPYVDEELWLTPDETVQVLDEFTRLRRICHEEEFLRELDGRVTAKHWYERAIWLICLGETAPAEFERELDEIEAVLWQALAGNCWLRIML